MSSRFRFLPHTADVSFIAYGKTFRDALENAGAALLSTMFDTEEVKKDKGKTITATMSERADTKETMVWYSLQKALSKIDELGVSACGFTVKSLRESTKGYALRYSISYKHASGYHSRFDVKAITPYGLEVNEGKKRWSIKVVMDV
jgi:SHS2 domain-containing protein